MLRKFNEKVKQTLGNYEILTHDGMSESQEYFVEMVNRIGALAYDLNDMTRFIIACTSVTQLIYMSEVGGLLLGSKIPVKLLDLIILFIERTIITLPIIVLCANFIF